jgi:hypothetical protein
MSGPNWKLEDDYKTVTVTFPTDPPVGLKLDAAGVDDMLENLGEFRANMTPGVPDTWAPGQTFGAVPDPRWVTEPDAMMGNSVLHIRDPRYGWLHYMIPREEARKLIGYLQNQVNAPLPGQEPGSRH